MIPPSPPDTQASNSAHWFSFFRFGKRSSDDSEIEMNKRKSAYMRFGKRSSPDMSGLEMQVQDVNKRKSAYMRLVG